MAEERVQRRLSAILAADVVGYSRMMGRDEPGTLAALKTLRGELIDPKISEYGGRIVKTTGDGLLMEFPSVVDAVQFSLDVQTELANRNAGMPGDKRIAFRIGVNLGDIIVDGDDIFGDGVNIAARLETLAAIGGIAISSRVFDDIRDRIDAKFDDAGELELKNIARPIRVFQWSPSGAQPAASARRPRNARSWASLGLYAAAALISLAGLGAIAWWLVGSPADLTQSARVGSSAVSQKATAARRKLRRAGIIVLPFVNQSGDASQEYFSDGITEDLISALAQFSSLAVISRNAAFTLKGKAVKPRDIAREFGIRYIVEGSLRVSKDRVRVSAQLSDARSGRLLWSQKYDEARKDNFSLQDLITKQIVGALAVQIETIEQRRVAAKSTKNPDAYDSVLRGRKLLRVGTRVTNRQARALFEQAGKLDPQYAAAFAALGKAYLVLAEYGWTENVSGALSNAFANAQLALKIDPSNYDALNVISGVLLVREQYDQALAATENALRLNPSNSESMYQRVQVLLWLGHIEEAVRTGETALTFDRNPSAGNTFGVAMAYYQAKRHAEAAKIIETGIVRFPRQSFLFALLAACYGQMGKTAEASRALANLRRNDPFFQLATFGSRFRDRQHQRYLAEGLVKAGFK